MNGNALRRRVWNAIQALAGLTALIVILLVAGALRDPTQSLHGMLGSSLWSTFGPHMVLLSGVALLIAVARRRRGGGALPAAMTGIALIAVTGSTAITARIVAAAYEAGGYANPLSGLWLSSMTASEPDVTVAFEGATGHPLNAAVYRAAHDNGVAPVLVYIHGGGFKVGSIVETSADLRWFADRGWLVFSVGYRLWTDDEATWDKAPKDIACGLAWVNAQARRYGGDPHRLALLGDSAGGNLAINFAYAAAAGHVSATCPDPIPVPDAVVTQYPAVDPLSIYEHGYPVPGFEPQWLVSGYIGGDPYAFPERVRAVSSYSYLSQNAPPTLIIAPENDGLVPASSVLRFAERARLAGIDLELVRIPFANHAYNQIASNSIGNQARLSITHRYLDEQGLSPVP